MCQQKCLNPPSGVESTRPLFKSLENQRAQPFLNQRSCLYLFHSKAKYSSQVHSECPDGVLLGPFATVLRPSFLVNLYSRVELAKSKLPSTQVLTLAYLVLRKALWECTTSEWVCCHCVDDVSFMRKAWIQGSSFCLYFACISLLKYFCFPALLLLLQICLNKCSIDIAAKRDGGHRDFGCILFASSLLHQASPTESSIRVNT